MTWFHKTLIASFFVALAALASLGFTASTTGSIEWSNWNKVQQQISKWNLFAAPSLDTPRINSRNSSNLRSEQDQQAVVVTSVGIPRYPQLSELGLNTRSISSINCSNSLASQTLLQPPSKNNVSADLVITFLEAGQITRPQENPNHFIHDVWNGIMFQTANCVDFSSRLSRSVSIPHLAKIPLTKECRDTFNRVDPVWQNRFLRDQIGTLVSKNQWLDRNEVLASHENCSTAHSFGPTLAYMTALLLAGPSGSILEYDAKPTQEDAILNQPEHWIIRHEDRAIFRSNLILKPYTDRGLRKAFKVFRNLAYHYILGSGKTSAELEIRSTDRSMCRIVLYDRSNETCGHKRIWDDSGHVQSQLKLKFPRSRIVLLTTLPPRLADQVLLFSGLDVFITLHGGWEPNVMFLRPPLEDKIVIESPKECNKPGMDRWWMQRFRNILGFRLFEIPCQPGSSKNHQLLEASLPLMETELRKRGCQ